MNSYYLIGWVGFGLVVAWIIHLNWLKVLTVREYERALRFRRGSLVEELGPGRYWLRSHTEELVILDTRRQQLSVSGQEVLTADRVPIKASLVVDFAVTDVSKAIMVVDR